MNVPFQSRNVRWQSIDNWIRLELTHCLIDRQGIFRWPEERRRHHLCHWRNSVVLSVHRPLAREVHDEIVPLVLLRVTLTSTQTMNYLLRVRERSTWGISNCRIWLLISFPLTESNTWPPVFRSKALTVTSYSFSLSKAMHWAMVSAGIWSLLSGTSWRWKRIQRNVQCCEIF